MEKLCPFRRRIFPMDIKGETTFNTYEQDATFFDEEFLPCIKAKCAFWIAYYEQCGMKTKFN